MYDVKNFIKWALTHVNPDTIPDEAKLPLPIVECGVEPMHYLFGTVYSKTTRAKIEERWQNYYSSHGWKRADYDLATASFRDADYATDCQGLCDAYLTYECNEKTDINAHMNYTEWCTEKGKISEIARPYVIGEAVFYYNKNTGKMTHVGWICGSNKNGEPLVVEARGLRYGVVVTKLSERPWTHRGLMTKKFNYESEDDMTMDKPIVLAKTSPMMQGEGIKQLQKALNALGYKDDKGCNLDEDGKCGNCTMQAITAFANAHAIGVVNAPEPIAVFVDRDSKHTLTLARVSE